MEAAVQAPHLPSFVLDLRSLAGRLALHDHVVHSKAASVHYSSRSELPTVSLIVARARAKRLDPSTANRPHGIPRRRRGKTSCKTSRDYFINKQHPGRGRPTAPSPGKTADRAADGWPRLPLAGGCARARSSRLFCFTHGVICGVDEHFAIAAYKGLAEFMADFMADFVADLPFSTWQKNAMHRDAPFVKGPAWALPWLLPPEACRPRMGIGGGWVLRATSATRPQPRGHASAASSLVAPSFLFCQQAKQKAARQRPPRAASVLPTLLATIRTRGYTGSWQRGTDVGRRRADCGCLAFLGVPGVPGVPGAPGIWCSRCSRKVIP